MKHLLQFSMEDGTEVFVEVNDIEITDDALIPVSRGDEGKGIIIKAQETFEEAFNKTRPVLKHVSNTLRELQPDDLEIEFALTFNMKAGVFAQLASEANFKVILKWSKEHREKSSS